MVDAPTWYGNDNMMQNRLPPSALPDASAMLPPFPSDRPVTSRSPAPSPACAAYLKTSELLPLPPTKLAALPLLSSRVGAPCETKTAGNAGPAEGVDGGLVVS